MKLQRVSYVMGKFSLVLLLAGVGPLAALGATIPAASPNRTDVLAAITAAANGDTVTIPAGTSAAWTDQIILSKNIIIKGASKTTTTLVNGIGVADWHGLKPIFYVTASGTWRITGIGFDGQWTTGGKGVVVVGGNGRINDCLFRRCYDRAIQTFVNSGVIDHCIDEDSWAFSGHYSNQYAAWNLPLNIGTTNCWVVEDCYVKKTGAYYAPVGDDGGWGARYTWRFNTLSNVGLNNFDYALDAHGNQGKPFGDPGTSIAGTVFMEAYNNTFSMGTANRCFVVRGGTMIHYNNTVTATGGNLMSFGTVWYATEEDGYRFGSPILQAWPSYQGITNTYIWSNTYNGSAAVAANWRLGNPGFNPCLNPNGCGEPWTSDNIFIQQNRDWFLTMPTTNFYRPLSYPHPRVVADNDPPIPPVFALTAPANLATGISIQPMLTWADTTSETGYRVLVSNNLYFSSPVVDTTLAANTTSYSIPGGLLANITTYYWTVRATSTNGVNAPTSPFVFTTGSGVLVPGSLRIDVANYVVSEDGGTIGIALRREGGSDGAVGVSYGTANGTAIAGTDYTTTSGTQAWGNGDAAVKQIVVPIIANTGALSDLQFTFTIHTPTGGATLGSPATTTVTVTNTTAPPSEPPLVSYPTFNAYEGLITVPGLTNAAGEFYQASETANTNGGRVAFRIDIPATNLYRVFATVRAPSTAANSFFIDFNNDPPATPTAIWSITPLTAAAGVEARYVSWVGNGTVQSQFPTNTWALDAGTNTLYIRGREASTFIDEITIEPVPVPGTIVMASTVRSINENSTPITITARRTGGTNGAVGVTYTTANGTAISGVNYTGTTGTLSWADGNSADKTFNVTIIDDGVYGPDLTFTATLSNPTGGAAIASPTATTVSVLNVNPPPPSPDPGDIQFAVASQSVNEDAGTATIVMRRVDGTNGIVGISYETQDITAVAGVNYTTASGTESWADGSQTDQTFTVTILDDGAYTTNLTFRIIAHTPTGGAGLGTPTTNVVTILNTNPPPTPPPQQSFAWAQPGFSEAESTTPLVVYVDRLGATNGTVTVNYATSDGTAAAGINYTATSGTLTFADGIVLGSIPVTIIDNTSALGNKFFYVTLSNPTGAVLGASPITLGVIEDDETPPLTTISVIRGATLRKTVIGPRVP